MWTTIVVTPEERAPPAESHSNYSLGFNWKKCLKSFSETGGNIWIFKLEFCWFASGMMQQNNEFVTRKHCWYWSVTSALWFISLWHQYISHHESCSWQVVFTCHCCICSTSYNHEVLKVILKSFKVNVRTFWSVFKYISLL